MQKYLAATPLLDYTVPAIQTLVQRRGWAVLPQGQAIKEIYDFVRLEVLFGYNTDDATPASRVLAEGMGQCNTKAILFLALLRAVGVPCRMHASYIKKRMQKGVIKHPYYAFAPAGILHGWAEVWLKGTWVTAEGLILDGDFLRGM